MPGAQGRVPRSAMALKDSRTTLLVDMSIALPLLAIPQQYRRHENKDQVDAHDGEGARKDIVQEIVGEGRQGRDATALSSCHKAINTDGVHDERRRGMIQVSAADELCTVGQERCDEAIFTSRVHSPVAGADSASRLAVVSRSQTDSPEFSASRTRYPVR